MAIVSVDQIESAEQMNAARSLVREFTDYALTLDPEAKNAHAFKGLEEQLASLPGIFGPGSCIQVSNLQLVQFVQ